MPKIVPPCPVCGRNMPSDGKSCESSSGVLLRFRQCPCGYSRLERVTTVIEEYFPESAPVPLPVHPGEGGVDVRRVKA